MNTSILTSVICIICWLWLFMQNIIKCIHRSVLMRNKKENNTLGMVFSTVRRRLRSKRNVTFVECKKKTNAYLPKFDDIFNKKEVHIWCQWYKKYIRLNSKTREYIEAEYKQLFEGKRKSTGSYLSWYRLSGIKNRQGTLFSRK